VEKKKFFGYKLFIRRIQNSGPEPELTFHGICKTSLLFLSPKRRDTLNFPPTLPGLGVRGLDQSLAFPHNVKSQVIIGV